MPAGEHIKGRVFNVIGDAIDGMENLDRSSGLQFIEKLQLKTFLPLLKYSTQELKLLTRLSLMPRGVKLAYLGVLVLVKQF